MTWTGSVLLVLGILAGLVHRNVLDGPRFVQHLDAMRRDPAVSRQIGLAITDQVLLVDPELVSVRPLVEAAAISLAGSPTFSSVFKAAAIQLHGAFTGPNSGQVVLRLADVGAVLAGVLPAISSQAAALVPADLDVTLTRFGDRSFASETLHWARVCSVLAWLLPLLALLFFLAGIWFATDRLRATVRTGWAIAAGGAGVGAVAVIGAVIGSTADRDTLRGALIAAAWRQFGGSVWWAAAIAVGAGGLLIAAATARIPQVDLAREARRIADLIVRRPATQRLRLARGIAFAVVGFGALVRPALVFGVLGALVGLSLLLVGVGEIAAAVGARPESIRSGSTSRTRWIPAVVLVAATAAVAALVAIDAAPANTLVSAGPRDPYACNGHIELCNRPYNDVAFPATHNSMSAADEPGWFIAEQPTGLIGQLNDGIRALLIDTWYGQTTQRRGLIATAPGSHAAALAEADELYGPSVVTSALRLRGALTPTPNGPVEPYLCHSLCEIGATLWEPVMAQVQAWLAAHPREVVTFIIQDAVSPTDTANVFKQAGLLPYVHTQQAGQPWPTLQQMIDSGQRVVVMMERHDGGTTYPWLMPAFTWVQDTPFANPTTASLTSAPNRGTAASPLLLLNYWLNNFRSLVSDARNVNAYGQLSPYASKCREERGMIPNFVAVNYYNLGDLFRVIDQLNGFP